MRAKLCRVMTLLAMGGLLSGCIIAPNGYGYRHHHQHDYDHHYYDYD